MTGLGTRARSWLLLGLLSLIWGSSFILMKKGLEGFGALELGMIRLSVAALCLSPLAARHFRRLDRKTLGRLFVIGLTGNAVPAILFARAETVIPSAVVGVLTSMMPIFTLVVGWMFFELRFPLRNVVGILVAFGGAVLLATAASGQTDARTHLGYAVLVVVATISYGVSANMIKRFFSGRDPVFVATVALSSVGWPSLFYLLLGTGFVDTLRIHPAAPTAFGYIALLGAVGTALAAVLFNRLLQVSSLIFASAVTYTIPLVALLWGVVLREELTATHVLGFAVILPGVWLANRRYGMPARGRRPRPAVGQAVAESRSMP